MPRRGDAGVDHINTPFLIYTEGQMEAAFANVRWVPGAAKDAGAACRELQSLRNAAPPAWASL